MTGGNINKLPTKKVVFADKKKQNETGVFCSSRKSTLDSIWDNTPKWLQFHSTINTNRTRPYPRHVIKEILT